MSRPSVSPNSPPAEIRRWVDAWKDSDVTEEGTSQTFLNELCDLLGTPRPAERGTAYVFERKVKAWDDDAERETTKSIDLYRRDHFILESKKYDAAKPADAEAALLPGFGGAKSARTRRDTAAHRKALNKAKKQAEAYVAALPEGEAPPPVLLVLDVGHSLEVYAEFSRRGKNYRPLMLRSLKDARHIVAMDDLTSPAVREELAKIWTAPASLDRSQETARITRTVAGYLAKLAARYEQEGHHPELVSGFLTRCLFCMFAEDVGLLPKDSFKKQLVALKKNTGGFVPALQRMFAEMEKGAEHSGYFEGPVLHFNGGVFADTRALPLQVDKNGVSDTLELLIEASAQDWSLVEPAIFGTLLERALNPDERHKLGAHFTPRAYVERLVAPTLLNDLREEWENTEIDALAAFDEGRDTEAFRTIDAFHKKLCAITVLDPACGSGNFLYVAYDLIKELESEVIFRLREFGKSDKLRAAEKNEILRAAGYTFTVDPHQFLGLELNPRAVRLASLVLWIGHLRRHRQLHGDTPPAQPVLKDFQNIRHADAALTHAERIIRKDASGRDTFTWSRAMKTDASGREIPDTASVLPVYDYPDARPADWLALLGLPRVDYIVGNPPFIGGSRIRELLGDGYAEALWAAYPDMGESSDFVMYWWRNAARLAATTDATGTPLCRRFGFITTNSLRQIFNRRVLDDALHAPAQTGSAAPAGSRQQAAGSRQQAAGSSLALRFAIPDHPWVDNADGAAVRVAMTVASARRNGNDAGEGRLLTLLAEGDSDEDGAAACTFAAPITGRIHANLTIGAPVADARPLRANAGLACPGFKLHGAGFIVTSAEAEHLGLGTLSGLERHIRPYRNNRDLTELPREVLVIDLFGLSEAEVRDRYPKVFEHVLRTVKPERDANNRETYKKHWWIFGEARRDFRPALAGLPRYIATGEVSKHRVFQFLDAAIAPDNMLVAIALNDAFHLGVLSSRWHTAWALAAGGTLEDRPRYNKTACFDPYPFPECGETLRGEIAGTAEALDAHRKRITAQHGAGITAQYNALADLRSGKPLDEKRHGAADELRSATLAHLHDTLDRLVARAYGAPADLPEADILERLCALNTERTGEEASGIIRLLRPEYQAHEIKPAKPSARTPHTDKTENKTSDISTGKPGRKTSPQTPAKTAKSKKPAGDPARIELRGTRAERIRIVRKFLPRDGTPVAFSELAAKFAVKDGTRAELDAALRKTLGLIVEHGYARHSKKTDTYRRTE